MSCFWMITAPMCILVKSTYGFRFRYSSLPILQKTTVSVSHWNGSWRVSNSWAEIRHFIVGRATSPRFQ